MIKSYKLYKIIYYIMKIRFNKFLNKFFDLYIFFLIYIDKFYKYKYYFI